MITVTPLAEENVISAMEAEKRPGDALRITVQRGGTPQVQYDLSFAPISSKAPSDLLLDIGQIKVLIDNQSALYLKGAIIDYIHDLHGGGFKISNPNAPAAPVPDLTSQAAKTIQKLLEEKINPGVAGHGGHVTLVDVKETAVYLRLGGGCQGCGMADVTLKQGIEVMIKEAVPTITSVLDVTDHAGGNNPYYQPSK
ncbi:MAG: iron-sulfur cluster assembly accessory protein [Nitrospirae bacterium]|nr:iron-sulfur cluster assembly accessory protein [Nitrospirota bacterium]MBI3352180.1 iron-sulfur cluster assembly accessory protein [Nitrospirota bacterium]